MNEAVKVALFVEDSGHRNFILPVVRRIASEEGIAIRPTVRSALGGRPRVFHEFKLYRNILEQGTAGTFVPDVLIVAIDGNCQSSARTRDSIRQAAGASLAHQLVCACPDPHVERWYMADPEGFAAVAGTRPRMGRKKCVRSHYKNLLASALQKDKRFTTIDGTEFAEELVACMDFYRASREDASLKAFLDEFRDRLRNLNVG